MGFFSKIKQTLGVGTVKVNLTAPGTFSTNDGRIEGTVNLIAKSDQTVLHVEIRLDEHFTTGHGNEKKTKTYEIGKMRLAGFDMKEGEERNIPFNLDYIYKQSSMESLASSGGVLGGLGKLGAMASGDKSEFKLVATCDVKGAALDPNDILEIRRVK